MKLVLIELTRGYVAWTWDWVYYLLDLGRCKWSVAGGKNGMAVYGHYGPERKYGKGFLYTSLGKVILCGLGMPQPSPRHQVDHMNRVPLDNRPENLRWLTPGENSRNRRKSRRCGNKPQSKYLGVLCHEPKPGYRYWRAYLLLASGRKLRKCFPFTPEGEQAAAAWVREQRDRYFPGIYVDAGAEVNHVEGVLV